MLQKAVDNCRTMGYNDSMMNEGATMYKVTKFHTAGFLKGMTTTETIAVKFVEGFVCKKAIGGGAYIVTKVEKIA